LPCQAHKTEIEKNSNLRKKLIVGFTVLSAVVVFFKWLLDAVV